MTDRYHRLPGHPPAGVAERLQRLRQVCVPMGEAEARQRMTAQPVATEVFAVAVARRLDELRALCELADYVHQRR